MKKSTLLIAALALSTIAPIQAQHPQALPIGNHFFNPSAPDLEVSIVNHREAEVTRLSAREQAEARRLFIRRIFNIQIKNVGRQALKPNTRIELEFVAENERHQRMTTIGYAGVARSSHRGWGIGAPARTPLGDWQRNWMSAVSHSGEVAPGEFYQFEVYVEVPRSIGDYRVITKLDPYNRIARELDDRNNQASFTVGDFQSVFSRGTGLKDNLHRLQNAPTLSTARIMPAGAPGPAGPMAPAAAPSSSRPAYSAQNSSRPSYSSNKPAKALPTPTAPAASGTPSLPRPQTHQEKHGYAPLH